MTPHRSDGYSDKPGAKQVLDVEQAHEVSSGVDDRQFVDAFFVHEVDGLGNPLWLVPICRQGSASSYGAKSATARTDIPQYHECSSTRTPAFTHVGAFGLLANRGKLQLAQQAFDAGVVFSSRSTNFEPFRFWNMHFFWEL